MREVSRDEQFVGDNLDAQGDERLGDVGELIGEVDAQRALNAPVDSIVLELRRLNEATLANTALLMRLYDIHMAQLKLMGGDGYDEAQRLYSAHDSGQHWNPTIFVPEFDANAGADAPSE